MLRDVGDPELIRFVAMKLALDPVAGGGHAGDPPKARPPRDPLDTRASHLQFDGLVAHHDAVSEAQIGMDAADAVGTSGRRVHW